ncbi:MAG: hypothetical protein JXR48_11830 [Candidatus Delongbacteria bacterium]|nr:hypothetical protein [Candidatus Delongbacteria bacterium]MBN2835641.1 hypothetical protein [Candidatus Delongbacteria bacterium]
MFSARLKIHDSHSIEIKSGYKSLLGKKTFYRTGMYLILPESLDIDPSKYTQSDFYKDIKTNIRLITPENDFKDFIKKNGEFDKLEAFLKNGDNDLKRKIKAIHLFATRFRASCNMEFNNINNPTLFGKNFQIFNRYQKEVIDKLKNLMDLVPNQKLKIEIETAINYHNLFIEKLYGGKAIRLKSFIGSVNECFEEDYLENSSDSERLVQRSLIKKYIESVLYLNINFGKDGLITEQILFGLAAGLAMLFSTIIVFSTQEKYGNFSSNFFIILVVSYIFKDRLKDIAKLSFAEMAKLLFYDFKRSILMNNKVIGYMRELFYFTVFKKMDNCLKKMILKNIEPMELNALNMENIINYTKKVKLKKRSISDEPDQPSFDGVNDITRVFFDKILRKADNPVKKLYRIDSNLDKIHTDRFYDLFLIFVRRTKKEKIFELYKLKATREELVSVTLLDSDSEELNKDCR